MERSEEIKQLLQELLDLVNFVFREGNYKTFDELKDELHIFVRDFLEGLEEDMLFVRDLDWSGILGIEKLP